MSNVEFYRCERCGNLVALLKKGGGELTCCGQSMTKLSANTTDAAQEKHVPSVEEIEGKIKVSIGTTLHPMEPEHYIEWVALETEEKVEIKYLKPGDQPIVEFDDTKCGCVYAYCNLHGLWKTELDYVIPNEAACSPEFTKGCVFV